MTKKINAKDVKSLIYEVIHNTVKSIASEEFTAFEKLDTTRRREVESLSTTFRRFVAKTAKNVRVYVERTYDRSKRDYFTTILVLVDEKPELLLPSMFVNRIINAI